MDRCRHPHRPDPGRCTAGCLRAGRPAFPEGADGLGHGVEIVAARRVEFVAGAHVEHGGSFFKPISGGDRDRGFHAAVSSLSDALEDIEPIEFVFRNLRRIAIGRGDGFLVKAGNASPPSLRPAPKDPLVSWEEGRIDASDLVPETLGELALGEIVRGR